MYPLPSRPTKHVECSKMVCCVVVQTAAHTKFDIWPIGCLTCLKLFLASGMRDMIVRMHLIAARPLASFTSSVSVSVSDPDPSSELRDLCQQDVRFSRPPCTRIHHLHVTTASCRGIHYAQESWIVACLLMIAFPSCFQNMPLLLTLPLVAVFLSLGLSSLLFLLFLVLLCPFGPTQAS